MSGKASQSGSDKDLETIRADVGRLMARAQSGDASTLPVVREWLSKCPDIADELGGNLAIAAERAWSNAVAGKDILVRECLKQKLTKLRLEIGGPRPSPLERLLVERIALCWLQVHHADAVVAWNIGKVSSATRDSLAKRQERAQRSYLAAIKTLAQVRRLLTPAIQVNIAEQQVNLAAPGAVALSK